MFLISLAFHFLKHARLLVCPYTDHSPYRLLLLPPREFEFWLILFLIVQGTAVKTVCPRYWFSHVTLPSLEYLSVLMFPEFYLPRVPLNSLYGDTLLLLLPWSCHCPRAAIFQINTHFSYLILLPRTMLSVSGQGHFRLKDSTSKSVKSNFLLFPQCHMSRNLKVILIKDGISFWSFNARLFASNV